MPSTLFPCWLLATYPPCYHLLQYIHAEIPFSKSKLSLNQISLETANSGHRLHNITLWKFCLPAVHELSSSEKKKKDRFLVPLLEHAFFSASRCHILTSHSPDFTDFKAQRPQQGTWSTSSPGQAIWVPLLIYVLSEVTEVMLIPFSSLKTGLLHATHNG